MQKVLKTSIELSGTIIVTDPCYIFKDEDWLAVCDLLHEGRGGIVIEHNGGTVLICGTAFGDGTYTVTPASGRIRLPHSMSTPVDAGLICAMTLEDAMKINPDFSVDADYPVIDEFVGVVQADGLGNFVGDLECITDGSDDEEEDDDWFGEDEEEDDDL